MNGAHDLGGMQGFGPVAPEDDEPPFHHEWERRVFALTLAMGASGSWNLDMSRHARESLPPARYLSSSYYEIWLAALEDLMRERGLVSARELDTGTSDTTPATLKSVLKAEDVAARLAAGGPVAREPSEPARFRVGDRVTARKLNPTGHIRLPRYARGIEGRIARVHGCHILPDAHAHGRGEAPEWLYNVAFEARDLWGAEGGAGQVHVDLWESYLDPA